MVSMLFCTKMQDNETIRISGVEKYSKYLGYGNSFQYNGNYIDNTDFIKIDDKFKIKNINIVAMDALPMYDCQDEQFEEDYVLRELNKCYCAFLKIEENDNKWIATGNWVNFIF
jgi:poly(ADP-ribose) glycohydrolase